MKPDLHPVIHLSNVSVRYSVPVDKIGTLKEYVLRSLQGQIYYQEFWALKNINLKLGCGETLGIIGKNGSGKSTFLKVVSRVLPPQEGQVHVIGSMAPLLDVSAGFHPELTGRENIYLNGTILGFSRKAMHEQLGEILSFADIGNFIDVPIRTYSSGMVARLGFAIATTFQPDILILDEILAVGDQAFREKCYNRMKKFRANGVTILLVSHDLNQIRSLCTQVVYLEQGKIQYHGDAETAIRCYQKDIG